MLCIGMRDQENDHPEDYRERLKTGIARDIPMICANPDIKVRIGDELVWCAGALAAIYEEEGGRVIYPGKPHPTIYELAIRRAAEVRGEKPASVLCIGDSPATDMRGAARQGFDALYVGTGLAEHGDDFEAEVAALLEQYETSARYAMPALKW